MVGNELGDQAGFSVQRALKALIKSSDFILKLGNHCKGLDNPVCCEAKSTGCENGCQIS